MAKLIGPLHSLEASGQFGKSLVFGKWKGINVVRKYVIPTYRNTDEQKAVRDIVVDASLAWKEEDTIGAVEIDSDYKAAYDLAAAGSAMSGFNLFIKECMTENLVDTNGVKSYDGTLEIRTAPGVPIA
jgi:hypothetical protein